MNIPALIADLEAVPVPEECYSEIKTAVAPIRLAVDVIQQWAEDWRREI